MITYEFKNELKNAMQAGQFKIADFELDNKQNLSITALNTETNKIADFKLSKPHASNADFDLSDALIIAAGISDYKNTYGHKYFSVKYLILQDKDNAENKIILADETVSIDNQQGGNQ